MTETKRKQKSKSPKSKQRQSRETALVQKYTEEEKDLISDYTEKCKSKPKALGYSFKRTNDGGLLKNPNFKKELVEAFRSATVGAVQPNLSQELIKQVVAASLDEDDARDTERAEIAYNAIMEAMAEFAPRDGIEGMLVTQMVSVHHHAMKCLEKANNPFEIEPIAAAYRKQAENFMKLFIKQVEALQRHRGKAHQKVTVEHVNVNEGGQAIVGNVNTHKPTNKD